MTHRDSNLFLFINLECNLPFVIGSHEVGLYLSVNPLDPILLMFLHFLLLSLAWNMGRGVRFHPPPPGGSEMREGKKLTSITPHTYPKVRHVMQKRVTKVIYCGKYS